MEARTFWINESEGAGIFRVGIDRRAMSRSDRIQAKEPRFLHKLAPGLLDTTPPPGVAV